MPGATCAAFGLLVAAAGLGADPPPPAYHAPWIESVSAAIARIEGWSSASSLVRRLHNPGALMFARQPGATEGIRGFAHFPTDELGWAALVRDLELKAGRGMSVAQIARARTGPGDDVALYVRLLVEAAKNPMRATPPPR